MTAPTITDLNNATLDLNLIADVATSVLPLATDRKGRSRRTVAGATAALDASVADVAMAQADAKFLFQQKLADISLPGDLDATMVAYEGGSVANALNGVSILTGSTGLAADDNTTAITAAEAAAGVMVYLPPGIHNTTIRATQLTKRYFGPGVLRADFLPYPLQTANDIPQEASWHPDQLFVADRPVMVPPTGFWNAFHGGTLKITGAGDSITEVADGIYGNSVCATLGAMLSKRVPYCNFQVTNLSILGRSLNNLVDPAFVAGDPASTGQNDSATWWRDAFPHAAIFGTDSRVRHEVWPTGSTTGKSWLDHVKDTAPDILVVAHGTNNYGETGTWRTAALALWAAVQTWTKIPFLVFVPPAKPSPGQATAAGLQVVKGIADLARSMCLQNGWGLIDANALSRVVMDGVQVDYGARPRERNFYKWTDATVWAQGVGNTRVEYGSTPGYGYYAKVVTGSSTSLFVRKLRSRDVDVSMLFELATSDALPFVTVRSDRDDVSHNGLMARLESGASLLRIYHYNTLVLNVSTGLTLGAGSTVRLRMRAHGGYLWVWVNNVLLVSGNGYIQQFIAGSVAQGFDAGNGEISEHEIEFDAAIPQSTPSATMPILFGVTPAVLDQGTGAMDSRDDSNYYGGDGVHHPAASGFHRVYAPAVGRFVSELIAMLVRDVPSFVGITTPHSNTSGAQQPVVGSTITVLSPAPNNASGVAFEVSITFPYTNTGTGTTAISLFTGAEGAPGGALRSWYLEGSTGSNYKQFSAKVMLVLGGGPQTLHLRTQGSTLAAGGSLFPIELIAKRG